MEPFTLLRSVALPIARANVDTDQILPARYLQKPRANDFGAYLFRDLRDLPGGAPDPEFVLNRAEYRGARIVVAARTFGCGSSREHAVWALADYGIRALVAPAYGDIFRSNAMKNGLLPVVLPEDAVMRMLAALESRPGAEMTVDLGAQTVLGPENELHRFEIEPFPRHCLLAGLDELAYTFTHSERIAEFERRYGP